MAEHSPIVPGSLSWTKLESLVYSNSLGIGGCTETNTTDTSERRWVYRPKKQHPEELPKSAFPTLPLGLAFKARARSSGGSINPWEAPLLNSLVDFDPLGLLHGEQYIQWPTESGGGDNLPLAMESATFQMELIALLVPKKGGAVLAYFEQLLKDPSGNLLCTTCASMFLRGAKLKDLSESKDKKLVALQKNLTGPKGLRRLMPWRKVATASSRDTDNKAKLGKREFLLAGNQASIYRLNGDDNPIHIDPEAAASVKLQAPIVHGLCTFGYAVRGLLLEEHSRVAQSNPEWKNAAARLQHVSGRFISPVLDGDTLEVRTATTIEEKPGGKSGVSRSFVKYEVVRTQRAAGSSKSSSTGAAALRKPVKVMVGTASFLTATATAAGNGRSKL